MLQSVRGSAATAVVLALLLVGCPATEPPVQVWVTVAATDIPACTTGADVVANEMMASVAVPIERRLDNGIIAWGPLENSVAVRNISAGEQLTGPLFRSRAAIPERCPDGED